MIVIDPWGMGKERRLEVSRKGEGSIQWPRKRRCRNYLRDVYGLTERIPYLRTFIFYRLYTFC